MHTLNSQSATCNCCSCHTRWYRLWQFCHRISTQNASSFLSQHRLSADSNRQREIGTRAARNVLAYMPEPRGWLTDRAEAECPSPASTVHPDTVQRSTCIVRCHRMSPETLRCRAREPTGPKKRPRAASCLLVSAHGILGPTWSHLVTWRKVSPDVPPQARMRARNSLHRTH
jgi:hypothetical protein